MAEETRNIRRLSVDGSLRVFNVPCSMPRSMLRPCVGYLASKFHCLYCGKQTVLVEDGEGDLYGGPDHLCTSCWQVFTTGS